MKEKEKEREREREREEKGGSNGWDEGQEWSSDGPFLSCSRPRFGLKKLYGSNHFLYLVFNNVCGVHKNLF